MITHGMNYSISPHGRHLRLCLSSVAVCIVLSESATWGLSAIVEQLYLRTGYTVSGWAASEGKHGVRQIHGNSLVVLMCSTVLKPGENSNSFFKRIGPEFQCKTTNEVVVENQGNISSHSF